MRKRTREEKEDEASRKGRRERRRRHKGFKDLIEQARKRLGTTAANTYTRKRTRHQGKEGKGGGEGIKDSRT